MTTHVTVGEVIAYLSKFDFDTPFLAWREEYRSAMPIRLESDFMEMEVGAIGRNMFRSSEHMNVEGVETFKAIVIDT